MTYKIHQLYLNNQNNEIIYYFDIYHYHSFII